MTNFKTTLILGSTGFILSYVFAPLGILVLAITVLYVVCSLSTAEPVVQR